MGPGVEFSSDFDLHVLLNLASQERQEILANAIASY